MTPIITERLHLRPWQDSDREPFAAMSADPAVMQYLPPLPTRAAADAWIDRQSAHMDKHGFCFWAAQSREDGAFVGAVGLQRVPFAAHFTPAVEVGWRIAHPFWGRGYAPEAARAAVRSGFEALQPSEIVAITLTANQNSRRVMEKIGMLYDPADDFDFPGALPGGPVLRTVLYRLPRERWLSLSGPAA